MYDIKYKLIVIALLQSLVKNVSRILRGMSAYKSMILLRNHSVTSKIVLYLYICNTRMCIRNSKYKMF